MGQQRFTQAFKAEAAKQVLEHGHSVADVSRRSGMKERDIPKQAAAYFAR